jgi:hypothetical protein
LKGDSLLSVEDDSNSTTWEDAISEEEAEALVSPMTAYNNYMSCISKCGSVDVSCYQTCATVYQNELMDSSLAMWGISWDSIKEKAKALKDKVAKKAKELKDKVKDKFSSS